MSKETREILTHKEMIAINQDPLGRQAFKYSEDNGLETWFTPLAKGDWAVTFLNRSEEPRQVTFNWMQNDITDPDFGHQARFTKTPYKVRDVWNNQEFKNTRTALKATVPPHDVLTLRLTEL